MRAADVMVTDVIVVRPEASVREAAGVLLKNRISAAPVVGEDGRLVGIISEGDLVRRAEIGTERQRSWWLELLTTPESKAQDFVKSHAVKVADVMTRKLVTATEDTDLREVANLLEKHGVKRVPVISGDRVVGIVSRRNILQAFAQAEAKEAASASDTAIRDAILDQVRLLPWGKPWLLGVGVNDGVVELWGPVDSPEERHALRVAAESTPGVKAVTDNLYRVPLSGGA